MVDSSGLLNQVRDALAEASSSLTEMLRRVTDASAPAVGEWSVGETAAHLASSGPYFLAVARGEVEPEGMGDTAANNARALAENPERDPVVLADQIEAGEAALAEFLDTVRGDPVIEVFRGARAPLSTLVAVEVGELLVHGFDIAGAAGLPWRIDREQAAPTVTALLPLIPHLVDNERAKGVTASLDFRIRGGGSALVIIEDGAAKIEAAGPRRVDCHMSVDPAVYLLLGFKRIGLLRPLLAGKLTAWGRRPWVAARFSSLFRSV